MVKTLLNSILQIIQIEKNFFRKIFIVTDLVSLNEQTFSIFFFETVVFYSKILG